MANSTDSKARQAEALALLLAPDSPARKLGEFTGLFTQLEELTQQQKDVEAREQLLQSVLPQLVDAERAVADVEKQLAQDKATLADYAGELGKAAFDALRAGEITDGPIFADRKELQGRIDDLQQRKQALGASQQSGVLEKAKTQAQILALTGQLKLEEFKVGAANKALGTALLASKNLAPVRCASTEPLLKAIVQQNKRVTATTTQLTEATVSSSKCSEDVAKQIGHSGSLTADILRSEIAAARKQISACGKALGTTHREMLLKAVASDQLKAKIPALCHLEIAQEASPAMAERIKQLSEDVSKNVLKHRSHPWARRVLAGAGVLALLFVLSLTYSRRPSKATLATRSSPKALEATIKAVRELGGLAKVLEKTGELTIEFPETVHISDLSFITAPESLALLSIKQGSLSGDALKSLSAAKGLKDLTLHNCKLNSDSLAQLSRLTSLFSLDISRNRLRDEYLSHIAPLTGLIFLRIGENPQLTDNALKHLTGMKKLHYLSLLRTDITGERFAFLARLPELADLSLMGCFDLTKEGLRNLADCKKLNRVDTRSCDAVKGETLPAELCREWDGRKAIQEMLRLAGASVSTEAAADPSNSSNDLRPRAFQYSYRGRAYTGAIESYKIDDELHETVWLDSAKTGTSFSMSPVLSLLCVLARDQLHSRGSHDAGDLVMFIECSIGNIATLELFDGKHTPHLSLRVQYIGGDPATDGTGLYGKPATAVPAGRKRIVLRDGNKDVIDFGVPVSLPSSGWDVYKDIQSTKQLALIRQHIENPNLRFVIGNTSLSIDNDTRRSLLLFDRAVATLRYRRGARDSESRETLGD